MASRERASVAQMLGELLREGGILLFIFGCAEQIWAGHDVSLVELGVLALLSFVMIGLGIGIERFRGDDEPTMHMLNDVNEQQKVPRADKVPVDDVVESEFKERQR